MVELGGYFYQLAADVRAKGADADDVLNLLCRFELNGEPFDLETIASHLTLLIIGGAETFPKTFANTTQLLAEHPDQRAKVVADPSLIPDAFQESLRYWMPTQFLCRTVTNELEIRGKKLEPGQPVLFIYPAANRDDEEFDDPDVFDIGRKAKRILSFGAGTHACIGMHAAKLEGKVCLEEMLAAFPEYEIDLDNAERLVTDFVQGYASFPITF
jgi:cytochrome P450